MKQKLGLACALVHAPELLLLDEPTVGVDPLSRHELWQIILALVKDQNTSVLISTSYLDEADHCGHVLVLYEGKILAQGSPASVSKLAEDRVFVVDPPSGQAARGLQARLLDDPAIIDAVPEGGRVRFVRAMNAENATGIVALQGLKAAATPARFEDGFMTLLRDKEPAKPSVAETPMRPLERHGDDVAVEVDNLMRMFGKFTAVDHIGFKVRRGELFGLLGPNGAGKTTTFRMLCGLLPVTSGTLRVAGLDLRTSRAPARQRIGYVAQKFSLYGELSPVENLEFFASAYGLSGEHRRKRIEWALRQFELESLQNQTSRDLPGGYKQRLAMAAALLHEPEILFLDEPTSGADPLARRGFWRRITALAEQGVTVIITTHFMEEAEYCDRVAIMDEGRFLAQGTPAEIRQRAPKQGGREPTMEDAFIAVVEESRNKEATKTAQGAA
jgi:ABC-2 type transport system ATP-binding protein